MSKGTRHLGIRVVAVLRLGSGDSLSPIFTGCVSLLQIGLREKPGRECRLGRPWAGLGPHAGGSLWGLVLGTRRQAWRPYVVPLGQRPSVPRGWKRADPPGLRSHTGAGKRAPRRRPGRRRGILIQACVGPTRILNGFSGFPELRGILPTSRLQSSGEGDARQVGSRPVTKGSHAQVCLGRPRPGELPQPRRFGWV